MLGLRYYIMLCNNIEYKNMGQDGSLGQLYDVQIEIKIFYKQPGWAYSFSTTLSLQIKGTNDGDIVYGCHLRWRWDYAFTIMGSTKAHGREPTGL
jgi:hypothetical protein